MFRRDKFSHENALGVREMNITLMDFDVLIRRYKFYSSLPPFETALLLTAIYNS